MERHVVDEQRLLAIPSESKIHPKDSIYLPKSKVRTKGACFHSQSYLSFHRYWDHKHRNNATEAAGRGACSRRGTIRWPYTFKRHRRQDVSQFLCAFSHKETRSGDKTTVRHQVVFIKKRERTFLRPVVATDPAACSISLLTHATVNHLAAMINLFTSLR